MDMNNTPYSKVLAAVRERKPLVHHITNYVTVNDCANITLCISASPVMAHAPEEVEEMVAHAGVLVLNIGTLSPDLVSAMLRAGRAAELHGIPIVLDPVGAGATTLRTSSARLLISDLHISVIKGNPGEIGTLAGSIAHVRGVDSHGVQGDPVEIARAFAERSGTIVAISGATDIVSDGDRIFLVENGHPLMGAISGTGCMAASLIGACAAVSSDHVISSVAALATFGLAGERAAAIAKGPGSFKPALFDALAAITPEDLRTGAKIRSV
jgi:hydroxyethylthiazole kinase